MGNATSSLNGSTKGHRAAPEPEWKKHPTFPPNYEDFQVLRELKGSSKPQKLCCKQLNKSGLSDYFVSKSYSKVPEQLVIEFSVNNAYRAAGIMVPAYKIYGEGEKRRMVGQWIDGKLLREINWNTPEYQEVAKKLHEGFALDCLFGNWDVIGKYQDNIVVDRNGNPWRIDNGGSLSYRAMGERKKPEEYNENVESEFTVMKSLDEKKQKVFGWISSEDVQKGITLALAHRQAILDCIPEGEKEMLGKRFDWLEKNRDLLKF